MLVSRRVRTVAAAGALAVALSLFTGPADPVAQAAPGAFTIVGGGYGHGIGMSQYGAHGMALRGASAGRIISYYYGGAQARPATLPATIRVGLLQADHDPAAGGRLGRVLVKGVEVPGKGGSGRFAVSGLTPGGHKARRSLSGHTTWSIRPESGGTSVFDPSGRRAFGPTRAGTGVVVRFQTALPPARLSLPQTGQQLRWGRLDVHLVRDNRGVTRPRAVAVIPFNRYLRGLAEVPGSFANEALRAQAIAARSYALVAVRSRTQRWGYGRWDGCDCASTGPSATSTSRLRQGAGLLRGALGRGRPRHRVAGRALRLAGRAGLLLVVLGRLHLQQRPVGERPAALVPEPLRRPV